MTLRVRQVIKINSIPVRYNGKGENGEDGFVHFFTLDMPVREQLLPWLKFQFPFFPESLIKSWTVTPNSAKRSPNAEFILPAENREWSDRPLHGDRGSRMQTMIFDSVRAIDTSGVLSGNAACFHRFLWGSGLSTALKLTIEFSYY